MSPTQRSLAQFRFSRSRNGLRLDGQVGGHFLEVKTTAGGVLVFRAGNDEETSLDHETLRPGCKDSARPLSERSPPRRLAGHCSRHARFWAELPPPWEVLAGMAECTREQVDKLCRIHEVDPEAKGWTAPRRNRTAVPFQPTPELVHGVLVSNPQLAMILKKAGWFSGKKTEPVPPADELVSIGWDSAGFVIRVESDDEKSPHPALTG